MAIKTNTEITVGAGTASLGTVGLDSGANSIGTVGLDAGTNTIGKLGANSGVDIGDVDVKSLPVSSTAHTQKTVSVGNTATEILAARATRKGFVIVNNDASTDCYLGLDANVVSGATAQANGGILLKSGGGSFNMDQAGGWTGAIQGITASGTAVVGVLEW